MQFIYLTKDSSLECDRERVLVNGSLIMHVSPSFLVSRIVEDGETPPVGSTLYFNGHDYTIMTVVETVEEIGELLLKDTVAPHLRNSKRPGVQLKPDFDGLKP